MGVREWIGRVFGSGAPDATAPPRTGDAGKNAPKTAAPDLLAQLRALSLPDAVARALSVLEGPGDGVDSAAVLRWLRGAIASTELLPDARLRVADFFAARGETAPAIEVLRPLASAGDVASLPALTRLADLARERGDLAAVAEAYEQVLAIDLGYPGVRERLTRLRAPARAGGAGATLMSPDAARLAQGRLALVRELGRGGAGAVFLAHDARVGRDVALKIYHPAQRADRGARLRAEAQVAASLASRHVVRVYDLFETLGAVAMEHCVGGSLRSTLAREAASDERRRAWLYGTAQALAVAHERGWVHRDLKPGNVLLRADDTAALADFGLARRIGAVIEPAEGTAGYVAPEARRGEPADPRIDVYAFGALAAEVLPGVTGETAALIRRCMSTDPTARPRDGAELVALLDASGPGSSAT